MRGVDRSPGLSVRAGHHHHQDERKKKKRNNKHSVSSYYPGLAEVKIFCNIKHEFLYRK